MNASVQIPGSISTSKAASNLLSFEAQAKPVRQLIWLYLILWLIEGGLRRWFLPSLTTPLLLVRDPVVLAIYGLAISKNLFPFNGFVVIGLLLATLTFFNALTV